MQVAFYAPLKPPDDPTPSGDRQVARLLFTALRLAGHEPFIASRLRSFEGEGDPVRQSQLRDRGRQEAEELLRRWRFGADRPPELWFTYHLYYKAPDWLGPAISRALGIPYAIAEASFAAKRAGGAWADGHRAVERALRHADVVLGLNPVDRAGVLPLLLEPRRSVDLPPFLDVRDYRSEGRLTAEAPRLIAVAMMRRGDKLASYRLLGAALAMLLDLEWSLDVVGDGLARTEVEAALAPIGPRLRNRGRLGEMEVAAALAEADLFVWPAINEAFGMALLEAQASGLPVVAGASGGVAGIVADGQTGFLTPPGDVSAFAEAVRSLIVDPERRIALGQAARAKAERDHDLPVAAGRLAAAIAQFARMRAV